MSKYSELAHRLTKIVVHGSETQMIDGCLASAATALRELEELWQSEHQSNSGLMALLAKERTKSGELEAERDRLRVIRCPDGRMHRWDGDGQCKDCCNYATDLIEAALEGG